ncbi:MAG TPA: metal-dependent transcriptional regulator [Bryobacteraceae bacterium]
MDSKMARPGRTGLNNSESTDDYLKAILELSGPEDNPVSSNALAGRLRVRAASVSGMLQKLSVARPSFVLYKRHHGVRLSPSGRKRALEIVRHHRLLERFLHDVLDYSWEEVHEEAERLEHFISEKLEDRIAAKLGDPETDPHGHPIPEKNGAIKKRRETPLSMWACGIPAVVSSVSDRDPALLRELARLGLRPGVKIILDPGVRHASLLLRIGSSGDSVRLNKKLAAEIYVSPGSPESSGGI